MQDLFSMDRTVLATLPLMWDILGTLCRSISTAATLAVKEAESVSLIWREECERPLKVLVHLLLAVNILSSRRCGIRDLPDVVVAHSVLNSNGETSQQWTVSHEMYENVAVKLFQTTMFRVECIWPTLCGCKYVMNFDNDSRNDGNQQCDAVFNGVLYPLLEHFLPSMNLLPADNNSNDDYKSWVSFRNKDLPVILEVRSFNCDNKLCLNCFV